MEKHANISLSLVALHTDSACGETKERKILWHYLNRFVSIGEWKIVKKCNNCALFESSFSYSKKKEN
jgi:hypothetical protein